MFELGEQMVRGAGVVTVLCFVIVAVGTRYGKMPTSGAAYGRASAAKQIRWIGLAAVCVGLVLMGIASI
jgi:hypothetical protein